MVIVIPVDMINYQRVPHGSSISKLGFSPEKNSILRAWGRCRDSFGLTGRKTDGNGWDRVQFNGNLKMEKDEIVAMENPLMNGG